MVDRLAEAEREITRYQQERERWINYTTDLQRIIEALCGNRKLPQPVSSARHHYNMAERALAERAGGQQDNEPRAYIVHAPEDDYYGTGPDRLQFHPLAQHDMDNGYRQTPLYGRPSEQAVTDEMVDAACEAFGLHERKHGLDHRQAGMRAALKAAMEAGRHE